ncbi:AI-2E family transporter [Empedobacter brevis]|uniref:AI-2E family transporter n=1 Tax=Empedobacter brevis TaxID=247 RepID=UPI0039B08AE7
MEVIKKWPFYIKLTCVLLSIICLSFISIIGKGILVPLILGFLISILLAPVCSFFERYLRLPRAVSSIITTLLFATFILGIFYLIAIQMTEIANEWPTFQKQIIEAFMNLQSWIHHTFGVNSHMQMEYLTKNVKTTIETSTIVIEKVISIVSSMAVTVLFTFLYIVFLLIYRQHLVKFLYYVFNTNTRDQVYNVITSIQKMVKQYLIGLFLQMLIVSVLSFIAFSILGLKYKFVLAILTGVLNVIPYVGIIISMIVTLIITFATMSASKLLFVLIAFIVIHAIDGNVVMPQIVGSKVKINSLIVIIGLVIGEMAWGIMGMLLSIPILALMKIVFDNVTDLKPWGYLLGDELSTEMDEDLNTFLAKKKAKRLKLKTKKLDENVE